MRYLFCCLSTHGFVYPAMGVAKKLRERSHEIAFATGPAFGDILRQEGFERIPRGETDGKSFEIPIWPDPLEVVRQVKHLEYAIKRFQPDVLVGHKLAIGPLIAAERAGLPVANLGVAAYLYPVTDTRDDSLSNRTRWEFYDSAMNGYNMARSVFGMPEWQGSCRDNPLLGDLFMVRSVPELEGSLDALPSRVHLVGDCLYEPPADGMDPELRGWLEEARTSGQPLLYVQPGKFFSFGDLLKCLFEALDGRPEWMAATVRRTDLASMSLPRRIFARPHLPQQFILPQARAVIASSSTTVVLGTLTHGLPSLLVPDGGEQYELADRCTDAGLSLCRTSLIPQEVSAASLRSAIDELMGRLSELGGNARRLQEAFARVDGPTRVADLLEQLGRTRGPLLRERV